MRPCVLSAPRARGSHGQPTPPSLVSPAPSLRFLGLKLTLQVKCLCLALASGLLLGTPGQTKRVPWYSFLLLMPGATTKLSSVLGSTLQPGVWELCPCE